MEGGILARHNRGRNHDGDDLGTHLGGFWRPEMSHSFNSSIWLRREAESGVESLETLARKWRAYFRACDALEEAQKTFAEAEEDLLTFDMEGEV